MENCKALVTAMLLLCLSFARWHGDAGPVPPSSPQKELEIQMLRTKVASLEDEISRRDEETLELESVVRERTAQTAALVAELDVLQKVNVADDESVMKASTQNTLLEEQIERLASDLEDQVRKGESLETRATEAEKTSQELSRKLESVEKTNLEQKKKIQELEGKLRRVQAKLFEMEKEAKMKAEELAKVHGMWLPHWLTVHVVRCQELASTKWQVHGKPMFAPLMQKVAEKLTHGQQLAKLHMDSLRNTTSPYASAVSAKASTAYKACRDAVQPYTAKARELALHHWQESKKLSQPYINQVVAASAPHVSRASAALEPYLRPVTSFWRRLVSSTSLYHGQVQKGVERLVKNNEALKPLSDDRLTWFTAFALFTLPVLSICKILSAALCNRVGAKRNRSESTRRG